MRARASWNRFGSSPNSPRTRAREDLPETRLAEVDLSGRVPAKVLGHHLLQLRELLVQRGDEPDLADDDGRVSGASTVAG